jgi:hypothetical protein
VPANRWIACGVAVAALLVFGVARGHALPVMLLVAAVAAVWLPAWCWLERPYARDQARRAKGLRVRCGYDLAGNVSGVCPECGGASGGPV